jgi:hypothetical protein
MAKNKSGLLTLHKMWGDETQNPRKKASRFLANFRALGGTRALKGCTAGDAHRDHKSQLKRKGNLQKPKVETEEERKERLYMEDVLLAANLVHYSNLEDLLTAVMRGSRTKIRQRRERRKVPVTWRLIRKKNGTDSTMTWVASRISWLRIKW